MRVKVILNCHSRIGIDFKITIGMLNTCLIHGLQQVSELTFIKNTVLSYVNFLKNLGELAEKLFVL